MGSGWSLHHTHSRSCNSWTCERALPKMGHRWSSPKWRKCCCSWPVGQKVYQESETTFHSAETLTNHYEAGRKYINSLSVRVECKTLQHHNTYPIDSKPTTHRSPREIWPWLILVPKNWTGIKALRLGCHVPNSSGVNSSGYPVNWRSSQFRLIVL
jgi:hypothetical protein